MNDNNNNNNIVDADKIKHIYVRMGTISLTAYIYNNPNACGRMLRALVKIKHNSFMTSYGTDTEMLSIYYYTSI